MLRTLMPSSPASKKSFLADYRLLSPSERGLWRFPLMWAAAIAILFIPVTYAALYLASVLDPYGNLRQLPVALVDADKGATDRGQSYDLGRDLVRRLNNNPPVKFVPFSNEAAAQAAVRRGEVYFALTIPQDFSQKAVAGSSAEHGLLHLYSAPGTSYFASRVGGSVAREIAGQLNEQLGHRRWEVVGESLGRVQRGFRDIKQAAGQLRDGAEKLADGSGRLSNGAARLASGAGEAERGGRQLSSGARTLATGVGRLTGGSAQLSGGLRRLEAAAPGAAQLQPLQRGAAQLAQGNRDLGAGLGKLEGGAQQLAKGSAQLSAGVQGNLLAPQQLKEGAEGLAAGAQLLGRGAVSAASGANKLATGAEKLRRGVNRLVAGNLRIKNALGTITGKLPAQADLDRLSSGADTLAQKTGELTQGVSRLRGGAQGLASGSGDLHAGAVKLRGGLSTLYAKVPAATEQLGGDPAGLTASVQVAEQSTAPVPNNGSAFAPYFMALALWVGGTLTTFIFPYLLLPQSGRATGQLARVARKFTVPACYVVAQALIAALGVHLLGIPFLHPGLVVFTVIAGSLTFMLLILALNLLLGAAGRLLALVLLVLQLAASGGSYPVELAPVFFQRIHAFIPVTDVINALRFAMFGSYEGQYGLFMGRMLLVALVGLAVALLSRRRWQFISDAQFRSPIISDVG